MFLPHNVKRKNINYLTDVIQSISVDNKDRIELR